MRGDFEDQYGTGRGQSYRPGASRPARSPPPRRGDYADSYRGPRPRSQSPPPRRDDFRRRSPSLGPRRDFRGDTYRVRPRSPPRRDELPRDDLFRRDPARDARDYRDERGYREDRERVGYASAPRSPPSRIRDRSPVPLKRSREPSPAASRGRFSPPPTKRERLDSPPPRQRYDDYPPSKPQSPPPRRRFSPDMRDRRASPRGHRQRSPSPVQRNDRVDPRAVDDWRRRRSPSTQRPPRSDYHDDAGRNSANTSRRSSPPVHPSRLQHVEERPAGPVPRAQQEREPYRERSPESRRQNSPPARERDHPKEPGIPRSETRVAQASGSHRADDALPQRAPPTAPAGPRTSSTAASAAPSGPAVSTGPSRASAAPPSGPRASAAPRGDFGAARGRGGFRGDFASGRGGYGGAQSYRGGRGGVPPNVAVRGGPPIGPASTTQAESGERESDSTVAPPAGPRNSSVQAPPPTFRQSSSTAAPTYPRSQRFGQGGQALPEPSTTPTGPRASRRINEAGFPEPGIARPHPALADLPQIVEGGQKLPPVIDRSKLDRLEEEAERLRKQIEEREARRRKGLREWDRLSRETEAAAFRTQLAEEALLNASGEAESAAAF